MQYYQAGIGHCPYNASVGKICSTSEVKDALSPFTADFNALKLHANPSCLKGWNVRVD